jgi:hypothetical protein
MSVTDNDMSIIEVRAVDDLAGLVVLTPTFSLANLSVA